MELNNVASSLIRVKPVGQPVNGSPSGADHVVRSADAVSQQASPQSEQVSHQEQNTAAREAQAKPSAEDQQAAIDILNAAAEARDKMTPLSKHNVNFQVDESSGKTIIRIIDTETKEVIRQFPPDELLQIVRNLENMEVEPKGVMVDREG